MLTAKGVVPTVAAVLGGTSGARTRAREESHVAEFASAFEMIQPHAKQTSSTMAIDGRTSRGNLALSIRAVGSRPASCNGRRPLSSSLVRGSIRPATIGSNFVGLRNNQRIICTTNTLTGSITQNGPFSNMVFRRKTQLARASEPPLQPMRSPYESVCKRFGSNSDRVATASAKKRQEIRLRQKKHPNSKNCTSIRSMLPWWSVEQEQLQVNSYMRAGDTEARLGRRNILPKSSECATALGNEVGDNGAWSSEALQWSDPSHKDGKGSSEPPHDIGRPQQWEPSPFPSRRSYVPSTNSNCLAAPPASLMHHRPQGWSQQQLLAYASLFGATTPQVPETDQYILSEGMTFGAISKQRKREAVPVEPGNSCVGVLGTTREDSTHDASKDESNRQGVADNAVSQGALLFPDEDIEKVRGWPPRRSRRNPCSSCTFAYFVELTASAASASYLLRFILKTTAPCLRTITR